MKETIVIEVGEHCFGPIARLNGQEPFDHEYSTIEAAETVKDEIIELLKSCKQDIGLLAWRSILEVIASTKGFECTEDSHNPCDQCGNYNWMTKYQLK